MNRTIPGRLLACSLVVAAGMAGSAHAQSRPAPPPEAAKPGDEGAMRGPRVRETLAPVSLVHRDMSGKLERLETRPEQAALDLLHLTPEQRKPADEAIAARRVQVNRLLQEHYELFIKLQTARQGGATPEEIRPLMREFRPIAGALLSPTLAERVAGVLPEEKRAEFGKLVEEYNAASVADAPAGRGGGGGGAERMELNLLLREMARAIKGIVDERKEHMDALLKAIDATPEQEAKIRSIAREAAEAKRKKGGNGGVGEPTQEERLATWRKILAEMTPEQRTKAMEARRGGG